MKSYQWKSYITLVYFDDIEEQELIIHDDINFYDVKNNLEKLVKNND